MNNQNLIKSRELLKRSIILREKIQQTVNDIKLKIERKVI
jgi:hypothetical protein